MYFGFHPIVFECVARARELLPQKLPNALHSRLSKVTNPNKMEITYLGAEVLDEFFGSKRRRLIAFAKTKLYHRPSDGFREFIPRVLAVLTEVVALDTMVNVVGALRRDGIV